MKIVCDETNNSKEDKIAGRINVDFIPETLEEAVTFMLEEYTFQTGVSYETSK